MSLQNNFLDTNGLTYYDGKIKDYIDGVIPSQAVSIAAGDNGYTTGAQVYAAIGNIESSLQALRGNI